MRTSDNHFTEIQNAVLDVSIHMHATNLIFKTQIRQRKTKFEDWAEWMEDHKEEIQFLISVAMDLNTAKKKKKLIN